MIGDRGYSRQRAVRRDCEREAASGVCLCACQDLHVFGPTKREEREARSLVRS